MSIRDYTCVVCPNGCPLRVDVEERDGCSVVVGVLGNICKRGEKWARQEVENPLRTIASSVPVSGGDFPMASVRTNHPIPLAKIRDVMDEIRAIRVKAPVTTGDVILRNPAGTDTDVIATRTVRERDA